jgi:16S rRNA (cytosine1402-N4)-methyltransferase
LTISILSTALPVEVEAALGETSPHLPVLYQEIIHALRPREAGFYVDCTLGAGGHAAGILEASSPDGRLLGLDVDPEAIALAGQRLAGFGTRVVIHKASYRSLSEQLKALDWPPLDGILLDLGASSMQFDNPARGFSFQHEAPLDMRFDPQQSVSAAELVNQLSEAELAEIIYRFGEERKSRQVARAIVKARPLHTTRQLAEVVARTVSAGRKLHAGGGHIHPATRTFQALRIAVNAELDALDAVLPQAVAALAPGGRLAVIAFHSLEDRMVKNYFRQESRDCLCPPRQPVCTCGHHAVIREVTRQPIRPEPAEIEHNPRSRSARLRVAEKINSQA